MKGTDAVKNRRCWEKHVKCKRRGVHAKAQNIPIASFRLCVKPNGKFYSDSNFLFIDFGRMACLLFKKVGEIERVVEPQCVRHFFDG